MTTAPITPWAPPAMNGAPTAEHAAGNTAVAAPPAMALDPLIRGQQIACSPQIDQLAAAMAKAQAEIGNPAKNKAAGDRFTYYYADLAAVLEAVTGPLADAEVALIQLPYVTLGATETAVPMIHVATILVHSSGQWMGSRLDAWAPVEKSREGNPRMNPWQALGNAMSYLRRYGAAPMTGVAQEDNDAAIPGTGAAGSNDSAAAGRDPRQERAGQRMRAEIDGMIGWLSADKAGAANEAWERAKTMPDLSKVRNRVKELAQEAGWTPDAGDAGAPAPPRTHGNAKPPAGAARLGVWWSGAAVVVGETPDGKPEWGAILARDATPQDGDPIRVKWPRQRTPQRMVVIETLDATDNGIRVRTRGMTDAEKAAITASATETQDMDVDTAAELGFEDGGDA